MWRVSDVCALRKHRESACLGSIRGSFLEALLSTSELNRYYLDKIRRERTEEGKRMDNSTEECSGCFRQFHTAKHKARSWECPGMRLRGMQR